VCVCGCMCVICVCVCMCVWSVSVCVCVSAWLGAFGVSKERKNNTTSELLNKLLLLWRCFTVMVMYYCYGDVLLLW